MPPEQTDKPVKAGQRRLLVPDFSRGLMLWGIAVANVTTAWVTFAGGPFSASGRVVGDNVWDKLTIFFTSVFMHARGFPMFTTLLGFGVGLIAASLYRRHYPLGAARGVLARRYGMLAVFGALHMVFLFWGDIMLAYGLLGMFMVVFLRAKTNTILWLALGLYLLAGFITIGIMVLTSTFTGDELAGSKGSGSLDLAAPSSYLNVLINGLVVLLGSLIGIPLEALVLLPLMMLGFVAAREGWLADPVRHRRVLLLVAGIGLGVGLVTGVLSGVEALGVFDAPLMGAVSRSFGVLGGPGFIALLALVVSGAQQRVDGGASVPVALRPLLALGRRSMTGYVLQSLIFLFIFAPFGLGLFADAGAALLLVVGTAGWLLTLLVAWGLEAAGKSGPLEAVHRRLSYGKNGLMNPWVPKEYPPVKPLQKEL
ncbi:MAG: DUF418 domain-containing protein [Rothia sp. (in: high G+C Gram-positive bacteria)]|nr:DUF418 domain-containing protein [Rothia sp. (in: high G+C Gram-positive bacteria)]